MKDRKIKLQGKLITHRGDLKIQFSYDIASLWNWFILKETGMIMQLPKNTAKIGLYRSNKYHAHKPDKDRLKKVLGKVYEIELDPTRIQLKFAKRGFWISYLNVECDTLKDLISYLGIEGNFSNHNQPHMTISNGKYFLDGNHT